jgi:hypothetical protein
MSALVKLLFEVVGYFPYLFRFNSAKLGIIPAVSSVGGCSSSLHTVTVKWKVVLTHLLLPLRICCNDELRHAKVHQ